MYHEKEKAATGLEPVTAKPFLPNPYLDYFDKLEFDLTIFLKSHVELLFHLPRYALLILTSISIFY